MTNTSETWQRIDELEEAYGRLADRRAVVWSRMIAYRMAGARRPAERAEKELALLDRQGLALAERITEIFETSPGLLIPLGNPHYHNQVEVRNAHDNEHTAVWSLRGAVPDGSRRQRPPTGHTGTGTARSGALSNPGRTGW